MNYEEAAKDLEKDFLIRTMRALCHIYENLRQKNFLKWIDEYPEYWLALCKMDRDKITPEFAETVMETLIHSNIVELQMVWLLKCDQNLDIFGESVINHREI